MECRVTADLRAEQAREDKLEREEASLEVRIEDYVQSISDEQIFEAFSDRSQIHMNALRAAVRMDDATEVGRSFLDIVWAHAKNEVED